MVTTTADVIVTDGNGAIRASETAQKSVCYREFRQCRIESLEDGKADVYAHADCEIDLLRCLNSVIGNELCGACSELAHQRLITVIGVRPRKDVPWWRRVANALHLNKAAQAILRELGTTGGKIVTLLAGIAYAYTYNLISPYIGPRADDEGDSSGGIGSSFESFYDSLSTFEKSLIAIPAIVAVLLLVLWLVRDRSSTINRLLRWVNQSNVAKVLFVAITAMMTLGMILIAVQEFRLY